MLDILACKHTFVGDGFAMSTKLIDVDGHILEPADLWVTGVESRYRERGLKLFVDNEGLEGWTVDDKPVTFFSRGTATDAASIGKDQEWRRLNIFEGHKITWKDGLEMNPGAWDPSARVELMDHEGIDVSILYPTLGLTLSRIEDPALCAAHCRAYNDWIIDFCQHSPGRLHPALTVPWGDPNLVVTEMKRTADAGPRVILAPGGPHRDVSYGRTHWDPVWAQAEAQGVPISLHVGNAGTHAGSALYPEFVLPCWWDFLVGPIDTMLAFASFFQGAVFDRFPSLKLVVLEAGCAWMPWWLERMDEMHEVIGFTAPMQLKPSEYFARQCWISMEPDDALGAQTALSLGADRMLWAYDYPHSDSCIEPIRHLDQSLNKLDKAARRRIMGENATELYGLAT